jgi:hypothetical protein
MSVLIIDNFLEYPSVVREWAINQKFYDAKEFTQMYNRHTDWPGKRTQHVVDLDKMYADAVLNRIATLSNRHFGISNISIKSYFQVTTKEDGDSWVHQDNDVTLAAILYLNPNAPVTSGTSLYRCKNINAWESYMHTPEGYNTLKTINRLDNKDLYENLFEVTDTIGNVFNRLVFYPGNMFHKSNDYFGTDIRDGRLTQIFFMTQENG